MANHASSLLSHIFLYLMFPLVKYRAIRVGEHGFITGILDPSAYASNRHAQESSGVEIE